LTQELQRDDSLPYREYIIRPGETLDFGIEWSQWLANRWIAGIPFAAGSVVRPKKSTGFEYLTTAGGMSAAAAIPAVEPIWPTVLAATLVDGSITWVCQTISTASLVTTISLSIWTPDAPITTSGASLSGTRALVLASNPSNAPDADCYLRNFITLANGAMKEGLFLLRSRAGQI
jgi:hypothetical protein